jgi:hypothetical protein
VTRRIGELALEVSGGVEGVDGAVAEIADQYVSGEGSEG